MNSHHLKTPSASLQDLGTDPARGLSQAEAATRLALSGPNELRDEARRLLLASLRSRLLDGMFLVLAGAALVSFLMREWGAGLAFVLTSALYLAPGLFVDARSRPTINALRALLPEKARVLRNSEWMELPASQLAPGDILQLEEGDILPADVRLIEAVNLRVQEAIVTGGSEPVEKQAEALSGGDLPLQERRNLSYMGARVTQGRGLALVTHTGMDTELGRIAASVQRERERPSPLQLRAGRLEKTLLLLGGALVLALLFSGALTRTDPRLLLLQGISLAAALAPAALPVAAAFALMLGAQRMLAHGIHVRSLPAADTLGSISFICSDKTGTLTENRMTVMVMDVADHVQDLTGDMDRSGSFTATRILGAPAQSALSLTAIGGALCNDARLIDMDDNRFHTLGDPTEGALVTAAARLGYWKSSLDVSFPRTAELPFDPERKRMTTVHDLYQYDPTTLAGLEIGAYRYIAFTKGSVDGLLSISSNVWMNGAPVEMDEALKARIEAASAVLAQKGMRVLAVAFRLLGQIPEYLQTDLEQNLTFLGLFGMVDPPRPEVPAAVALTRAAGIRTAMLTTDQPLTAAEIARQLGLMDPQATRPTLKKVLTGAEVEALSPEELEKAVKDVQIFVRLLPSQKVKALEALQEGGQVVSVTGDDVIDAPVLHQADVGAAMGVAGTEAAREAADVVLLDDSFASLVDAVKEGRVITENMRLFLHIVASGAIARALVMLLAPLAQGVPPLVPLQFIWLGLLVDGFLGVGLVTGRAGEGLMQSPPGADSTGWLKRAAWTGGLIGLLALALGGWFLLTGRTGMTGVIFGVLALAQLVQAWVLPARTRRSGWMLAATVFVVLFMAAAFLPGGPG